MRNVDGLNFLPQKIHRQAILKFQMEFASKHQMIQVLAKTRSTARARPRISNVLSTAKPGTGVAGANLPRDSVASLVNDRQRLRVGCTNAGLELTSWLRWGIP